MYINVRTCINVYGKLNSIYTYRSIHAFCLDSNMRLNNQKNVTWDYDVYCNYTFHKNNCRAK